MASRSNRWRLVSIGAYFAYVEHPFAGERANAVCKRLADEENLLTIPGDMFGEGQDRFVRIAFANVSDDKIPTVLERLERFGAYVKACIRHGAIPGATVCRVSAVAGSPSPRD